MKDFEDSVALSFPVAVADRLKGEPVTNWYNVTIWRKKDNVKLADFLKKGTAVTVIGEPKLHVWLSDTTGTAQGRIHITANNLTLQGSPVSVVDSPADKMQN
jgi:single-stranded DNA-binding protein